MKAGRSLKSVRTDWAGVRKTTAADRRLQVEKWYITNRSVGESFTRAGQVGEHGVRPPDPPRHHIIMNSPLSAFAYRRRRSTTAARPPAGP